jgi:hypothetical protein
MFSSLSASPLLVSILFAFATIYPDFQILLFFILPIKIKWIAWVSVFFVVLGFLAASFPIKVLILVSFGNYFLFFGPILWRNFRARQSVASRRAECARHSLHETETLHRCAVCQKTEVSDPELEFRVAADGEEYCVEHLPTKN